MKKNSWISLLSVIALLLTAFTCEDKVEGGHRYITFVNKSNDTIYVNSRWQIKISPSDTIYDCSSMQVEILSGDTSDLRPVNSYWETDFEAIPFIQFFIYPKLVSYKSCEESRGYQLKRYQLTKEELDRMNWVITYP